MKPVNILRTTAVTGAIWFGTTFPAEPGRLTSFAAPPIASHTPVYKDEYKDVVRFVCVSVLGRKPGAHVWQFVGDTYTAYDSLYSPELRGRLGSLPKGTRVAEDVSPSALTAVIGQPDPDSRELKDFRDFCTAHGLRLIGLPTT